jgi:hypothetical protein
VIERVATVSAGMAFASRTDACPTKETAMNMLTSSLIATTLAASFAASAAVPLNAAPVFVPNAAPAAAGVETVGYEQEWKSMKPWLGGSNHNSASYNMRPGYVDPRTGYRDYDGRWTSAAAGTDTMMTGSISARPSASHVAWCRSHYETYRASDNTYAQPRGPRRECIGPNG